MDYSQEPPRQFKTRKTHTKSRNGCAYCRKRRIKCNEARPSCSRCTIRKQPCEYAKDAQDEIEHRSEEASGPSLNHTPVSQEPGSISEQVRHDAEDVSTFEANSDAMDEFTMSVRNNLSFFDHYLDHACRNLESMSTYARRIGLSRLAAKNQGVLCSIMAIGAACLCVDILMGQDTSNRVNDFEELIRTGDHYHEIGMHTVRYQMASNQPADITEAHAHAILLFPYAMAQRRISQLLNSRDPSRGTASSALHVDSPGYLDWTILLRGISATGRAYWSAGSDTMEGVLSGPTHFQFQKTHPSIASHVLAKISALSPEEESFDSDPQFCIASKHALFPVVSSTRTVALESLRRKSENLEKAMRDRRRKHVPSMNGIKVRINLAQTQSLTACSMSIDLLIDLGKILFDLEQVEDTSPQTTPSSVETPPEDSSLSWLRTYAKRGIYDHASLACRTVFAWVSTTPDEYFELLQVPIKKREGRKTASPAGPEPPEQWDIDRELRLLAWEVWAHWLVFAMLIEHEAFWIPNLGIPSIASLAPMIQSSLHDSSLGSATAEGQDWWPQSMVSVALQLKKYHSKGLS